MHRPAILCDIGNVLVHFDFSIAARRLAARSTIPADVILSRLEAAKQQLESGQIDDEAFVRQARSATQFEGADEDFRTIWCEIFTANSPMQRTLAPLRGRVPLYLLSNTSGLHKDHLFATFEVFSLFDAGVYSYSARLAKPDPAIFRHTADELALTPANTLFIDDLPPNIAAAQQLGFDSLHYHAARHDAFDTALDRWLEKHHLRAQSSGMS